MIKLTVNEKYLIKYPIDGTVSFDVILADYRDNIITWGQGEVKSKRNGNIIFIDIPSFIPFKVPHFLMMMQYDDGSVSNYNPYIKVAEADIDNEVPEGLPNRTYENVVDDSDTENIVTETLIHSWGTWRDATHPLPEPIEGFYYFISNTFFDYLTGEELILIYNAADATLVDAIPFTEEPLI